MCLDCQVGLVQHAWAPKLKSRLQAALWAMVSIEARVRMPGAVSLLLCASCVLLLVACRSALRLAVRSDDAATLPETSHRVHEVFAARFQAYGGVKGLGYPISEESVQDGLLVQYFGKARMEYHPDKAPRYRVQLGLLGDTLGRREPPIPSCSVPLAFDPSRRHYPQTGHVLGQPFLAYYDSHGGLDRFGYPLSEPHRFQGVLVQDFQRARLIAEDGGIRIADWGRQLLIAQEAHPPSRPPSR